LWSSHGGREQPLRSQRGRDPDRVEVGRLGAGTDRPGGEFRIEDVQRVRTDPGHVQVPERTELSVHDAAMLPKGDR
jgi:hypothetical protein